MAKRKFNLYQTIILMLEKLVTFDLKHFEHLKEIWHSVKINEIFLMWCFLSSNCLIFLSFYEMLYGLQRKPQAQHKKKKRNEISFD